MKQISLKSLSVDSFKSFSKAETVNFKDSDCLILIAGDNKVERRLGANGAGKSTLFDALCFCLYGNSVKGTRIGDLVTYGEKTTLAEVSLLIDDREISIRRSGPPNKVYIDNQEVLQADLEQLLGMSRQRFLNSVLFGQAAPLFIDLSIPERGALLDEILDLQFWMRASDKAAKEQTTKSSELNKLKIEIGRTEGSLSSLESIEDIAKEENEWADKQQERVNELIGEFEKREIELHAFEATTFLDPPNVDVLWKTIQECREKCKPFEREIALKQQKISEIAKDIKFFDDHGECPVCSQTISRTFAHNHIEDQQKLEISLKEQIEEAKLDLDGLQTTIRLTEEDWRKGTKKREEIRVQKSANEANIKQKKIELDRLEKQIENLANETNPFTSRRERVEEERTSLEEKLDAQKGQETELSNKIATYDFWKQAFKRVRLFCISRVLQQLEIETMNAASSLGLIEWKITFATESETKSGTVKTGVQIGVSSPSLTGQFSAWSGGEGQRVRLCVALGLASLIQRWSGVRWDIEIFDEPTQHLSESGISDLLDLLKARADSMKKRIFVADHKGIQHAGVDKVITVVKSSEGSYVVQ